MDNEEVRMTLRLPLRLRDQLAASTANSRRSMNAEIVARLEQSLVGKELLIGATLEELLEYQVRQAQAALEFYQADKDAK